MKLGWTFVWVEREFISSQIQSSFNDWYRQEMELMAILREREKERNQMKLGSKVAERKRRRAAKLAEKKEKESLLAEKVSNSVLVLRQSSYCPKL